MGSVLSGLYQSPNASMKKKITEHEEFYDAVEEIIETDDINFQTYSENLDTDATESRFSHIQSNISKITPEIITDVEKELDYFEKVSLVFLLYDHEETALQFLLKEQANLKRNISTNILSEWTRSKHASISSWQNKFTEALCVIQNYALLRRLGFDKEEMKAKYMPTEPYTSLYLNMIMKALYIVCEQLSSKDTAVLLSHLASDFNLKNIQFEEYSADYLEMYLLHSFSRQYIQKNDLSNLINILKKVGFLHQAEILETVIKMNTKPKDKVQIDTIPKFDLNKNTENYANPSGSSCSEHSVIGANSIVKTVSSKDCYTIDENNVGICLIINQKTFYKENVAGLSYEEQLEASLTNLDCRQGTDVDKESLKNIFTKLGFRIEIRENLKHKQFIPAIEEIIQQFSVKDSCFVVCILSHGIENKVYAANSIAVNISDIRETLHDRKFPQLLGKPKVLIIQSCQGNEGQKVYPFQLKDDSVSDGPSNSNIEFNLISNVTGYPEKQDLLLCMSTVSGFASFRDRTTGSWYIQELCRTIDEECEENHFQDILTTVNRKVSDLRCRKKGEGFIIVVTMVPEFTTTLNKKLFLHTKCLNNL